MASPSDTIAELYSEHHGWLRGWLNRRLGNAAEAADLTQDTFIKVLLTQRKPGSELPTEGMSVLRAPRAYLATVAKHLLINYLRRQSLEQAYLEALSILPEPEIPSPERQILVLEALQEVDAMLDGLPSKVRLTFILAQVEGLTYAEIADQLNISLRSVKRYMALALAECIVLSS